MTTQGAAEATTWNRRLSLLTLAALLLTPLAAFGTAAGGAAPPRAHPALIELAAAQPEAIARVIVQTTAADGAVAALVARLGGTVTNDLRLINAVAATLPARAVPALARAGGVRWVSPDGPVERAGKPGSGSPATSAQNTYLDTLGVRQVWAMGLSGQGIAVAVIDSGVAYDKDFDWRVRVRETFSPNSRTINDVYGHGTHVAGIIGGNGDDSNGLIQGVAPLAELVSLKISDDTGMAYESDTVAAMQWVLDNKKRYNIRVVNLSINSTVEQSYHLSPINAAAEILWFNGLVVVASAGNKGASGTFSTVNAAPANDPFIITVGASDEKQTTDPVDDTVAPFSARGRTADGFLKPDVIAPGTDIVSVLSQNSSWWKQYPERVVGNGQYFRLSGTSMAAPMVAGAVALLLQDEPDLTPDQVKFRLLTSGRVIAASDLDLTTPSPYLDAYAAVTGTTTASANTGLAASRLLWTGSEPVVWSSVNWNSVNWNSVNWNSVNWNSVNWNSVNWNSVSWND